MSEEFIEQGGVEKFLEVSTSLPPIENHRRFVEAASKRVFFPQEDLDNIYLWWSRSAEVDRATSRLENSLNLEGIPRTEIDRAAEVLEERKKNIDTVKKGINNFVDSQDPKWGFAKPIAEGVSLLTENEPFEDQVTALAEALSETRDLKLDETTMKRKVAQHAWIELHRASEYANLHYQAETHQTVSTIDDLETEKDELIGALKDELWSEDQITTHRKLYRGMRALIRDYYDEDIATNLKVVWDALRGKSSPKTTAIDVLKANEHVLHRLDWEGAFEYDFDDLEED